MEELCNAVILQAVTDFRSLKRRMKRAKDDDTKKKLTAEMHEIRNFFLGNWFKHLSRADGAEILAKLERE